MKNYKRNISWESFQFDFQKPTEEKDDYLEEEDEEYGVDISPKLMTTPFGTFAIDDSMNPFKIFEFRLAHTNFDIDFQVVETLKKIPGIEILEILTRYQFIIGIGKMFDFRDVRIEIESLLCDKHKAYQYIEQIKDTRTKQEVQEIRKELNDEYKNWAIYVFPNGHIDYIGADVIDKEFDKKYNMFLSSEELSNGILITSDDE